MEEYSFLKTLKEFNLGDYKLWQIGALFGIILLAFFIGKITGLILNKSANSCEKSNKSLRATFLRALARSITFIAVAIGLSAGIEFLQANEQIYSILSTCTQIIIVIAIGNMLYQLIDVPAFWFEMRLEDSEKSINKIIIPVISKSLKITLVILIVVQIIQILSDKPITSVIAGLGIGGLAFALGAQDSLKHFFGSLVIIADKPFEIGDRIVVDGFDGPVEEVGLRSTKIRTLEGHLVTVPNGEMANKSIQNIGKRPYIRRLANIGITYGTPLEKIHEGVDIIKKILDNHEGMDPEFPPRVYFNSLNSDSLNIILIYWYHPPSYWDYMEFTERVNSEIIRQFRDAGIDFAFPTQTIHLANDEIDRAKT